jgi:hypothetical protein
VVIGQAHPLGGEPIDVWRLHGGIAVTAEGVAQIVGGDQEDIQFFRRRGGVPPGSSDPESRLIV